MPSMATLTAWKFDSPEGAAQAGKDPAALPFAQLQSAFAWEDGDALEVVRAGAQHHLGIYAGWAEGSDTPGKGFWVTPPSDDMLRQTVVTGTPQEVVNKLNAAVAAALADATVRKRLTDIGQEIVARDKQTPEALYAFHKAETEKWWPIIKAAKFRAESR